MLSLRLRYTAKSWKAGLISPSVEGRPADHVPPASVEGAKGPPPIMANDASDEALTKAMLSVFRDKRPTTCFLCLGHEKLPMHKRVHNFATPGDLSKHFRRRHLSTSGEWEDKKCGVCKMSLDHTEHLCRHALQIHGTVS